MLGFVDILGQHMDFASIFRKIGRNLFADIGVLQVGDFQRPVDGVVIGDGHMGHAAGFGDLIDLQRFGEAFRTADFFFRIHRLGRLENFECTCTTIRMRPLLVFAFHPWFCFCAAVNPNRSWHTMLGSKVPVGTISR